MTNKRAVFLFESQGGDLQDWFFQELHRHGLGGGFKTLTLADFEGGTLRGSPANREVSVDVFTVAGCEDEQLAEAIVNRAIQLHSDGHEVHLAVMNGRGVNFVMLRIAAKAAGLTVYDNGSAYAVLGAITSAGGTVESKA